MKASCWNTWRTKTDYIRSKLFEYLWYITVKMGLICYVITGRPGDRRGANCIIGNFPNSANVSVESTNLPTVAVKWNIATRTSYHFITRSTINYGFVSSCCVSLKLCASAFLREKFYEVAFYEHLTFLTIIIAGKVF